MAAGVLFLLLSIGLTLSDVTTYIGHVRDMVFIAGMAVFAAGAIFYGLARTARL